MIVVCGEALIDLVAEGDVMRPHRGGGPYNSAVALARLGVDTAFLGRFSTDPFGQGLRRGLAENGVDMRYALSGDEPTPLALVQIGDGGEAEYHFYLEGTADRLVTGDMLPALDDAVRGVLVGTLSLVTEPAADAFADLAVRESERRLVMLDPNVRPAVVRDRAAYVARMERIAARAHVVKLSHADAAWLYPGEDVDAVARRLLDGGAAVVAMTLGERGAAMWCADGRAHATPPRVDVVDTVGAGDAFNAGLLAWADGRGLADPARIHDVTAGDLEEALRMATTVSALTCARAGADPPHRDAVDDLLARTPA